MAIIKDSPELKRRRIGIVKRIIEETKALNGFKCQEWLDEVVKAGEENMRQEVQKTIMPIIDNLGMNERVVSGKPLEITLENYFTLRSLLD